jgi:hypothetical protein
MTGNSTASGPRRWLSLVAIAALAFAAGAAGAQNTPPIIVIGEVQGASDTVTTLFRSLNLIDDAGSWSGGDTVLIQTGDLIDGGENSRAAMDLFMRLQREAPDAGGRVIVFMRLQREAPDAGGRVIVLMGNHEAMNILGELRDVNYRTYASFAGPDSEVRRDAFFDRFVAWRSQRAAATGTEFVADEDFRAEWFALHPPGWVEYVEAMRRTGHYGRWLRSLPVAVEIDGILFIHGGLSPEMRGVPIQEINTRAADEIRRFDEDRDRMAAQGLCLPLSSAREMVAAVTDEITALEALEAAERTHGNPRWALASELQHLQQWGSWSILSKHGPLWFDGASQWDEDRRLAEMQQILAASGFERIVTGQSHGAERVIETRFDDRVILASVDLSDNPYEGGGAPAALEISHGDFTVVTLNDREALIDVP